MYGTICNFLHFQGLRIDYFYLTSMPLAIMMTERNPVHETTNNGARASGILLRAAMILGLPVIVYAFLGNLQVTDNSKTYISRYF